MARFDAQTLSKLSERDLKLLISRQKWLRTARPKQLPPDMSDHGNGLDPDWSEWGLCMGRGAGKTRVGGEWLAHEAIIDPNAHPSYVIAPTLNDVRYTCFEGESGILSHLPPEVVKDYNKTNLIITLDNGSIIRGFSAEEPERLRGPQAARAWCDEIAAWTDGEATWDMMMFGLRLGKNPRVVWTTTPKPKELIRKLMKPQAHRHITVGSSHENRANLASTFFNQLTQYEGTQLGRQEIEGELIDAEEGGIVNRSMLRLWPSSKPLPKFDWLIMSLDTALTAASIDKKTHNADPTACQVWGVFWHEDRTQVMLLDAWEDHLGFPDLMARVKKEREVRYGDDIEAPMIKPLIGPKRMQGSGRKIDILLIEDKGSGISLRQSLEREGIEVYAYNPGRADKLSRLHMVSHVFAQKRVWLPESEKRPGKAMTWTDTAVTQWCSFRGEKSIKFDDHVDAMTQSLRLCLDKSLLNDMLKPKADREADPHANRDDEPRRPRSRGNPYAA